MPGGVASAASVPEGAGADCYPFRDVTLPVEKRLDDLVGRMTLDEKIFTLTSGFDYHGCPRLGVADVRCADGPLGIASWGLRGRATAFPATLNLAASWNRSLAGRMGEAFAREWRARGLDVFYGPGVNLSRSPKSSRNFEYFGEDPYLVAEMAVPFTRAVQDGGVVAVVKHFAGNEQEFDRYLVDTRADERTLRELYMRPFEDVIKRGGAKAVMMAYNLLNGEYCAQNKWLIDVLRDEWGFTGTVMSDWGATHACRESLDAGLDMELGTYDYLTIEKIRPLVESGEIKESQIDDAVRNIYRPVMELGIFERIGQPDTALTLYSPRNAALASRAAEEGMVLLRNRGGLLPAGKDVRRIAVIGPNAAPVMIDDRVFNVAHAVYGGGGSSKVNPFTFTSDLQGIIDEFPDAEVTYSEGVSNACLQRLFDRAGVVNFLSGTDYIDLSGVPDTAVTRWETVITPDRDGHISLFVKAQGG
ncbi:MAG: glycoside hydrolase family 3 protein, partial [Muribaculaceae bacterium]|nr:glycoside hydrolase family 3 protein [Muribaculaceae bacterium]